VVRGSWFVARDSWLVIRGSWFVARGAWRNIVKSVDSDKGATASSGPWHLTLYTTTHKGVWPLFLQQGV
jgi:hypothetical protein